MNFAILQNFSQPKDKKCSLNPSKENLYKLVGKLGYESSDIDEKAEKLWSRLTELHTSDPKAYHSFIKKQVDDHNKTFLTPVKGFVVKARVFPSGNENHMKLFINFCSHQVVDPPIDSQGNALNENSKSLDDLQVPLIFSEIRRCSDFSTIDILFNPLCILLARSNKVFGFQLIQLGIESICNDTCAVIEKDWKVIKSRYKGGTGENNQTVHPFNINTPQDKESSEQKNESKPQVIMDSPASLLHSVKNNDNMENTGNITVMKKPMKQKKLIEVISETNMSNEDSKSKQATKVIKKGFLGNVKNSNIYPKGSSGDGCSGLGGAYSKLMSRCKVVDTATWKQSEPSKQHESTSCSKIIKKLNASNDTNQVKYENLERGFLNTKKGIDRKPSGEGTFNEEFKKLLEAADPLFANSSEEKLSNQCNDHEDEISQTLKDIANIIHPRSDHNEEFQKAENAHDNKGADDGKCIPPNEISYTSKVKDGNKIICINLSECAEEILNIDFLHLGVSDDVIELNTPNGHHFHLDFKEEAIDSDKVVAKFKRNKSKLVIHAPLK